MCHVMNEIFLKGLNGTYDLVVARKKRNQEKELVLICCNCHRMFEKLFFFNENFFGEVKKMFIELYAKSYEQKVEILGICHQTT